MGLLGNLLSDSRWDNVLHVLVCGGIVFTSGVYSHKLGLTGQDALPIAGLIAAVLAMLTSLSRLVYKGPNAARVISLFLSIGAIVGAGFGIANYTPSLSVWVQASGLTTIAALGLFHVYQLLKPPDNIDESRLNGYSGRLRHLSTAVGLIALFYIFGEDNGAQVNGEATDRQGWAIAALSLVFVMRLADTLMDHKDAGDSLASFEFRKVNGSSLGFIIEAVLVALSLVADGITQVNMDTVVAEDNSRIIDITSIALKAGQISSGVAIYYLSGRKEPLFKPLLRQGFASLIIALDAYALGDIQKNKSDVVIWWHFAATALYVLYDQSSRYLTGEKYGYVLAQ